MIDLNREKSLKNLEKKIKIRFDNVNLLDQALTHKSYSYEKKQNNINDNERMEFLGDAVLKLVISHYLIEKYPLKDEGELTRIRAIIVSDNYLAKVAENISLGAYLLMSENEKRTGGQKRKSNIANAMEAVFGAAYLDGGIDRSKELIIYLLTNYIDELVESEEIVDHKSMLQELVQGKKWELPAYTVVKETGPDHKKKFYIEVEVVGSNKKWIGKGDSSTKKEAEQKAAKDVLKKIK